MYNYIICMKNGKEYKIKCDLNFKDLIDNIMSQNQNEIKISHFNVVDSKDRIVAIIGGEVSSIEYFVKISC